MIKLWDLNSLDVTSYLDLLSQQRRLEVGLDDDFDLQFGATDFSDQRDDSERQDDVFGGSVPADRQTGSCCVLLSRVWWTMWCVLSDLWPHELVVSVWRDEADAALRVKLAEANTLMEGAVVDRYRLFTTEERRPVSSELLLENHHFNASIIQHD